MARVEVFSGPNCPYCDRAKALLKKENIAFEEFNVKVDNEKLEEMLKRSGGRRTIPQIFINGTHIGGCDDLYELHRQGNLPGMLI